MKPRGYIDNFGVKNGDTGALSTHFSDVIAAISKNWRDPDNQ